MVENKKKITIQNSKEGIHKLEAFIEDICYEYNIMNSYYSNIQLALNEAFFNAKLHGNKNREDKKIEISFYSDQKGLHFLVKDEGDGFDYSQYLHDNFKQEFEDNKYGKERGLLIIKLLVDELNFYDQGRTVELIFYISTINYSMTLDRIKHLDNYFKNITVSKSNHH
ncbi:MAG: ATP-binding protein [bacterium]